MAQRTGDAGIEAVSETLTACQQELIVLVDGKRSSAIRRLIEDNCTGMFAYNDR